jgi:hypothetical protein
MRISIENKGMLVSIDVDAHPNKKQALKLFGSMYDMYKDFISDENKAVACDDDECKAVPEPIVNLHQLLETILALDSVYQTTLLMLKN